MYVYLYIILLFFFVSLGSSQSITIDRLGSGSRTYDAPFSGELIVSNTQSNVTSLQWRISGNSSYSGVPGSQTFTNSSGTYSVSVSLGSYGSWDYAALISISKSDPPPEPDKYRFQDSFTNDGDKAIFFELGIFENDQLVSSKEYFMETGDSIEIDIVRTDPFEVGLRMLSDSDDGWVYNPWNIAPAGTVSPNTPNTQGMPEVNRDPIGPGLTPEFFENVTDSQTQQILDAIASSIGNTNARHEALKSFIDYYGDASARGQTMIINAVNARGAELMAAINELNPEDYGADFLELKTAADIITQSVNEIETALSLVSNKADQIKDGVMSLKVTNDEISGKVDDSLNQIIQEIYDLGTAIENDDKTGIINAINDISSAITNSDTSTELGEIGTQVGRVADALNQPPEVDPNTAILQQIRDKPDLDLTTFETEATNILEEIRDIEKARDNEGGIFDKLGLLIDTITDSEAAIQTLADTTMESVQAISTAHQSAAQTVIGQGVGSANANFSGGYTFPSVTLPILGTINFDPFQRFTWLSTFSIWFKNSLRWVSAVSFVFWFWTQVNTTVQNVGQTPGQPVTSDASGIITVVIKRSIVITIFLTVVVGGFTLLMTAMKTPILPIITLAESSLVLQTGVPAAVGNGLSLINTFIPMDHLISLFLLGVVVRQVQIPAVMGLQALIRQISI